MKELFLVLLSMVAAHAQVFAPGGHSSVVADADVESYKFRIATNSGTMSSQDAWAFLVFAKHAKSYGYWTNLTDACPFAGADTNASVVKLKDGTAGLYPKLTLNGFTSADYSREGSFLGKTNYWFDTGYSQTLWQTNSHGVSVWFMDTMTNAPDAVGGGLFFGYSNFGTPYCNLSSSGISDGMTFYDYDSISNPGAGTLRPGQGLYGWSRTSATSLENFINGVRVNIKSTTPTWAAPRTNHLWVYCGYATGSKPSMQNGQALGWYAIDSGIPSTLQPSYAVGVRELMRRIGRIPKPAFPQNAFMVLGQSIAIGTGSSSTTSLASVSGTRAVSVGTSLVGSGGDTFRGARSKFFETSGDTGWRAFADHLVALCDAAGYGDTNTPLMIDWAGGGYLYSGLAKGSSTKLTLRGVNTNMYQHSINDVILQNSIQTQLIGNPLKFGGLLAVHGESGWSDVGYGTNMLQWQSDYQGDINAITGQTNTIPLFCTQSATFGYPGGTNVLPYSTLTLLSLHETNGGVGAKQILVGPKYMLLTPGGTHLTNSSYEMMGEYYAEAVYKQVARGEAWSPLRPTNVAVAGSTITVTFDRGNLVFDTTQCSDPGNYGFTYTDDGPSVPTVSSAAISGASSNQVTVNLSASPNANPYIMYALNATIFTNAGPTTGARGNLRDQATAIGTRSTSNLWNWCVHFRKPAPWP